MFKQVLGEAVRLLVIGLVAGAIAAQFLTRLIASLLFGVTATDVPTYLLVFVVLSRVALVANYLPPAAPRASIRLRRCESSAGAAATREPRTREPDPRFYTRLRSQLVPPAAGM